MKENIQLSVDDKTFIQVTILVVKLTKVSVIAVTLFGILNQLEVSKGGHKSCLLFTCAKFKTKKKQLQTNLLSWPGQHFSWLDTPTKC